MSVTVPKWTCDADPLPCMGHDGFADGSHARAPPRCNRRAAARQARLKSAQIEIQALSNGSLKTRDGHSGSVSPSRRATSRPVHPGRAVVCVALQTGRSDYATDHATDHSRCGCPSRRPAVTRAPAHQRRQPARSSPALRRRRRTVPEVPFRGSFTATDQGVVVRRTCSFREPAAAMQRSLGRFTMDLLSRRGPGDPTAHWHLHVHRGEW
jgi:hypothetical protein